YETRIVKKLSELTDRIAEKVDELQSAEISLRDAGDVIAESAMIRDKVLPKMCELRVACDEAETITAKSYWPFPTYADILFSVR
ncbi:MAG: glutamine synthetase type III, partial [Clostridia bacterium]|nr:glutamine synthetase type III [Clostridia bacterium]